MGLTPAAGTVLLAGATGLVGGGVLTRLLGTRPAWHVIAPTRRPLAVSSPRLLPVITPLSAPATDAALEHDIKRLARDVDAYVCCLGTTIRAAGSRPAFLAVDRDLVLRLGAIARHLGARHAILVSSVGASAQSGNFYLRVKGETERGLAELGFERVDFLRPGVLLGPRAESRPGEALARGLAPLYNPLLVGPLRRYRGIEADAVAAATVALLGEAADGRFVHENAAIRALAARA